MVDIFVDRALQHAGILDEKGNLIKDDDIRKDVWNLYEDIIDVLRVL
jgi:hypothetical protein